MCVPLKLSQFKFKKKRKNGVVSALPGIIIILKHKLD